MPSISRVFSQGSLPKTTGQPETPLALGSNEAAARLGNTINNLGDAGVVLASYSLKQQQQADQVTRTMQKVVESNQRLQGLADTIRRDTTIPITQKAQRYQEEATLLLEEGRTKIDKDIGPFGAKFFETHFGGQVIAATIHFSNEMGKAFIEQDQLATEQLVETITQDAVLGKPDDVLPRMREIEGLIASKVGITYSKETAQAMIRTAREEVLLGSLKNIARAHAELYLKERSEGKLPQDLIPQGLPEKYYEKLDEAAREALRFREDGAARDEKKHLADVKKAQDSAYVSALQEYDPDIGGYAEERMTQLGKVVGAEHFSTLAALRRAATKELTEGRKHSDRDVVTQVYSRLNSSNPRDLPTEKQIASDPLLSATDAVAAIKTLHERKQYFETRQRSNYDVAADKGRANLRGYFRVTGFMDVDKEVNAHMEDAEAAFNARYMQYRDNPEGHDPLTWVPELVEQYQRPILERFMADANTRLLALPKEQRTVAGARLMMMQGKLTEAEYLQRLWIIKRAEELGAASAAPATSDATSSLGTVTKKKGKASTR